jgi:FkbM family methyltransferase
MDNLTLLRLKKLLYSVTHPWCWGPLRYGVAPSIEHMRCLQSLRFDCLLDVGANRGQFSLLVKCLYPSIPIHAYEPHLLEAQRFRKVLGTWRDIALHQTALGSSRGDLEFHISKSADSSSLLPIGKLQQQLFPSTTEASSCQVSVAPLDSFPDHWKNTSRALLKIDVQGYELEVLRGAVRALEHCAYVFVECSEVPLYEGQALRPAVQEFLEKHGFLLRSRHNETLDRDGNLIQADYLFERKSF